jgi:hypothetical protein
MIVHGLVQHHGLRDHLRIGDKERSKLATAVVIDLKAVVYNTAIPEFWTHPVTQALVAVLSDSSHPTSPDLQSSFFQLIWSGCWHQNRNPVHFWSLTHSRFTGLILSVIVASEPSSEVAFENSSTY